MSKLTDLLFDRKTPTTISKSWISKTFFNIGNVKVGSKNVIINGITRNVTIRTVGTEVIHGDVGKCSFRWSVYYSEPLVNYQFNGYKGLIKRFILGYITSPSVSPMHVNESNTVTEYTSLYNGVISGVPLWIREGHKVWTACHSTTTGKLLYYRRTKYKEDSVDLVKSALPICKNCNRREACNKPCTKINLEEKVNV